MYLNRRLPQPVAYRGNVNPIGPRACYDEGKRCAETLFFDYYRQHSAPHPVQWLSDNGSIFAAQKTIEIAVALNLCFTPVESPESNGMAEAFVKTFKRDYVRVSPIPDAAAALALIDTSMEDYNTALPIPGWAIAHPGSTSCPNPSRVRL
jgi:transposase InsO family protein